MSDVKYIHLYCHTMGWLPSYTNNMLIRGCVFDIVTRIRAGRLAVRILIQPTELSVFVIDLTVSAARLTYRVFFYGLKRTEKDVDHSPPSSAEVKSGYNWRFYP